MALLSLHSRLDFAQLAFASQEFLSFLVDLALHLDFDFSELLLLSPQLLLLEANRL
jgi:hypothetical protein